MHILILQDRVKITTPRLILDLQLNGAPLGQDTAVLQIGSFV